MLKMAIPAIKDSFLVAIKATNFQMSKRLITAMKNYVKVLMKAFNNVPYCRNNDWKQGQYVAKGSQNSDQGNQKHKDNLS